MHITSKVNSMMVWYKSSISSGSLCDYTRCSSLLNTFSFILVRNPRAGSVATFVSVILNQKNLPVIVVVNEDTLLLNAKSGQILSVAPVATRVISRGPAEVKLSNSWSWQMSRNSMLL